MQEISKLEGLYLLETSKDFYISRCNLSFHQHLEDLSINSSFILYTEYAYKMPALY
jgi:hypothetical protein